MQRKISPAVVNSALHTHKQGNKKEQISGVCMYANKQHQDQITLANHFQALQNLENDEESRQICTEVDTGQKWFFFLPVTQAKDRSANKQST